MDSVLGAARRTLEQVRTLRREGVVTAVDEQLALSRVSELEAARASADAGRIAAADGLLTLIGEPPGRPLDLEDRLVEELGAGGDPSATSRSDLAGLEAVARASEANVDRVRAQWLPSLGAFGSLNWNQGSFGALDGPRRWTAGLMVRWSLFRGLADIGELDEARARRRAAEQRLAAARREVEAEVRAAAARVQAGRIAVGAADRALQHAVEAMRVAESRYGGGVGTITELLAVRAAEASQRLARLEALYQARLARAALTLARGGTPE
jgi:outer membrane protein TolC